MPSRKPARTVVLLARNRERLHAVRDALPSPTGAGHDLLVADFADPAELRAPL